MMKLVSHAKKLTYYASIMLDALSYLYYAQTYAGIILRHKSSYHCNSKTSYIYSHN